MQLDVDLPTPPALGSSWVNCRSRQGARDMQVGAGCLSLHQGGAPLQLKRRTLWWSAWAGLAVLCEDMIRECFQTLKKKKKTQKGNLEF